jgi:hypothetical protein
MRGRPIHHKEISDQEYQEQRNLLAKVHLEWSQKEALISRQQDPLANLLLRETLLEQIKPLGLQN